MKNTVIIKGNKYGISIVLDKDTDFSKLLTDLSIKLESAENFFDSDKQLAVTFEGRTLSNEELDQMLNVITSNSKLNIQYVMDENSDIEATFFDIIQTAQIPEAEVITIDENNYMSEYSSENANSTHASDTHISDSLSSGCHDSNGLFYKGTLRSGQSLEAKDSIVIIGDVNPGAAITAGGNIVIIGALKGSAHAGATGNKQAFITALSMTPIHIQIADIILKTSDTKKFSKFKKTDAMIATIVDNQICIEMVSKSAIHDINIY